MTIYARGYSDKLPGDVLVVRNETDTMTDYFETDKAVLFPGHPLYPYARYAAMRGRVRGIDKRIEDQRLFVAALIGRRDDPDVIDYARPDEWAIEHAKEELAKMEQLKAQFDAMQDPGQPTAADVEAVHTLNLAAETARIAAEKEQEQKKREKAHSDLLEAHTAAGRVVSVSLAPWLEKAVEARQKAAEERARDTMDMVEMLTDDQLAAAVLRSPKKQPDIARFFLQQLANRDEKKALSVFRIWKSGEGLEEI